MVFKETIIESVYIINNFSVTDVRGLFVITFNKKVFQKNQINFEIRESYYSTSK
jgi:dTDP-4-dehydrorhamnose 3,5-epimerase-like enzyme